VSHDDFVALHITRSGTFRLPAPSVRVFPNFSPQGERVWAPGWVPEYLHPRDGAPLPGLVFRTAVGGERTLWLLLRYDAAALEAQYVRIVPDSRIGLVTVRCVAVTPRETDVTVAYELTALSAAGNRTLEEFTEAAFGAMLEDWKRAIAMSLATDADRH
jgi:hypothetical protein